MKDSIDNPTAKKWQAAKMTLLLILVSVPIALTFFWSRDKGNTELQFSTPAKEIAEESPQSQPGSFQLDVVGTRISQSPGESGRDELEPLNDRRDISVTLRDAVTLKQVGGAAVKAYSSVNGKVSVISGRLCDDGVFHFAGELPVRLVAEANGYCRLAQTVVAQDTTLLLHRTVSIAVRCVDPTGAPVAGVDVALVPPSGRHLARGWQEVVSAAHASVSRIAGETLQMIHANSSSKLTAGIWQLMCNPDPTLQVMEMRTSLTSDFWGSLVSLVQKTDEQGRVSFESIPLVTGLRVGLMERKAVRIAPPHDGIDSHHVLKSDIHRCISGVVQSDAEGTAIVEFVIDMQHVVNGMIPDWTHERDEIVGAALQYKAKSDGESVVQWVSEGQFALRPDGSFSFHDVTIGRRRVDILVRRGKYSYEVFQEFIETEEGQVFSDMGKIERGSHSFGIRLNENSQRGWTTGKFAPLRVVLIKSADLDHCFAYPVEAIVGQVTRVDGVHSGVYEIVLPSPSNTRESLERHRFEIPQCEIVDI